MYTCQNITLAAVGAGRASLYLWEYTTVQPFSQSIRNMLINHRGQSLVFSSPTLLAMGANRFRVVAFRPSGKVNASAEVTVYKYGNSPPVVEGVPEELSVQASRFNRIRAKVSKAPCITYYAQTTTVWSQVVTDSRFATESAVPTILGKNLKIKKNTLRVGSDYLFRLLAVSRNRAGEELGRTERKVVIRVKMEDIVPVISGGATRNVSKVARSYMVRWSALDSSDPANATHPLTYEWSIDKVGAARGQSILFSRVGGSLSSIQVNSSLLEANAAYRVQLTVEGISTANGTRRRASAEQILYVEEGARPTLTVRVKESNLQATKLDTKRRIRLAADLDGQYTRSQVTIRWTCAELVLGQSSLRSPDNKPVLTLAKNVLQPGRTYTFTATVTGKADGQVGSASIVIAANTPPAGGLCAASPSTGVALDTRYSLNCSSWTDADQPIDYRFRIKKGPLLCGGFSTASVCETQLPQPTKRSRGVLTLSGTVRDGLGAETGWEATVSVAPPSAINVTATVDAAEEFLDQGDTDSFSVYALEAVSQLANASTESSARAETQRKLLGQIKRLQSQGGASVDDAVLMPVLLVKSLAEGASTGGAELPMSEQTSAMEVVNSGIENEFNSFGSEESSLFVDAISGIASSLVGGVAKNESVNATLQTSISDSITAALFQIGSGMASGLSAEESNSVVSSEDGKIFVSAEVRRGDSLANGSVGLSSGARVEIPAGLPLNVSENFKVVVGSFGSNLYPSSPNSSGLLMVDIVRGEDSRKMNIRDLATPFTLAMPRNITPPAGNSKMVCRFWNETLEAWSTSGVSLAAGATPDAPVCSSTHLSTFSVEFQVEINTIDSSDITEEAYSYKNAMMMLTSGIILALGLVLIGVAVYDERLKRKGGENYSEDFWREHNRVRYLRFDESTRSMSRFRGVAWWSLRRRHPWLSIGLRHEGDFMNTTKRVVILGVLVFNTMAVCALLIDREQRLFSLSPVVSAAIVAMLISFPIPFFLAILFRRRVPEYLNLPLRNKHNRAMCMTCFFIIVGLFCGELVIEDLGGGGQEEDENVDDADDAREGNIDGQDDGGVSESEDGDPEANEGRALNAIGLGAAAGAITGTMGDRYSKWAAEGRRKVAEERAKREAERLRLAERKLRAQVLEISEVSTLSSDDEPEPDMGNLQYPAEHSLPGTTSASVSRALTKDRKDLKVDSLGEDSVNSWSSDDDNKLVLKRLGKTSNFVVFASNEDKETQAMQDDISTHKWTTRDRIALSLCLIVILGGWFIVATLSWKLRDRSGNWITATLTAFGQDFAFRVIQILIIDALFFMPVAGCCAVAQLVRSKRDELEVEFKTGYVGFWFEGTRVVDVDNNSPAWNGGVRMGMTVLSIGEYEVETEDDIEYRLFVAHRTQPSFKVRFRKFSLDAVRQTGPLVIGKDSKNADSGRRIAFTDIKQ